MKVQFSSLLQANIRFNKTPQVANQQRFWTMLNRQVNTWSKGSQFCGKVDEQSNTIRWVNYDSNDQHYQQTITELVEAARRENLTAADTIAITFHTLESGINTTTPFQVIIKREKFKA